MSDYIKVDKVLDLLAGVVAEIIKMPPEHTEERTETHECVSEHTETHDLISRKAAIKAVGFFSVHSGDKLLFADRPLKELPSVEPETIVRCKDCKHKYIEEKVWNCPFGLPGGEDFFCSYGARMDGECK